MKPCETCGKPTLDYTNRCSSCIRIEINLPDYMKSSKGLDFVRQNLPLLDDWVDGHCDAWDYGAVLKDNEVTVEWCDQITSDGINFKYISQNAGWSFYWKHGTIFIERANEIHARKAAALFISLWLRGVSASFADKLMDGYLMYLEFQCDEKK